MCYHLEHEGFPLFYLQKKRTKKWKEGDSELVEEQDKIEEGRDKSELAYFTASARHVLICELSKSIIFYCQQGSLEDTHTHTNMHTHTHTHKHAHTHTGVHLIASGSVSSSI